MCLSLIFNSDLVKHGLNLFKKIYGFEKEPEAY